MPFVSNAQRKYFNMHRAELERQGVNVDEWNRKSKGLHLPMHVVKKKSKSGIEMLKEATAQLNIPKHYKGYKVKIDNNTKSFGDSDDNKKLVRINKKKSLKKGGTKELMDTWEHEKMHVDHPKMLERTVYKKVRKKMKKIKKVKSR